MPQKLFTVMRQLAHLAEIRKTGMREHKLGCFVQTVANIP